MPDLAPFSLPGRFWRGNLHTHSTLSDGALEPDQVIEAYKATGYDFMMLSEHFFERYSWPIADTRKARSNRFTTLIGAELHAPITQVGELWHIVAAGLPLDFEPADGSETGAGLARRAAAAGAFVGIAHPAWSQLTVEDGHAIDVAHAVEVYNHSCAMECDRGDGWYLMDRLLNEGRKLTAFATDDAHFSHGEHDAFGG
ncbi:MAG TPA: phosphotransferase, partial [Aestuariivirgaceae bacterium]|nr:phosphotransferase [Aestuariivirgaceae bacterium]